MSNTVKKSIPRPGRKPAAETSKLESSKLESSKLESSKLEASPASTSRHIALLAAQAGLEKKATGIQIIDVMGKVDYADYLVLMTGASDRNVAAIAQEVDGALSKAGFNAMSVEGLPSAQWVLIDFVDVVVHVFQKDVRSLYDLDGLWMDADRVPMEPVTGARPDVAADEPSAPSKAKRSKTATKRPTKKAKTTARPAARAAAPKSRSPRASKAPRRAKTSKSAK